ncbi:MAG: DUF3667 domain-containing protein [Lysobacterales bacterium]
MSIETTPDVAPPQSAAAAPIAPTTAKACANCGAPMYGPYCYACGQPEKGMIRHLASVLADVLDTVFNVDSRIFRSLFPLYFRPGFLTCEYFAGRRTRYVTPFRLFFFLCIISFFVIQASLNLGSVHFDLGGSGEGIDSAQSAAEVTQRRDRALAGLEQARAAVARAPGASASTRELDAASTKLRKRADDRLAYLEARAAAQAKGEAQPQDPSADDGVFRFGNAAWDPLAHPFKIAWLPAFANVKLTELAVHAKENLIKARKDQSHLVTGIFSVLPQTLFVLMPLFAVLLKIVYIFKRRLYMEHLMVALHSHAFISLSLLLITLVYLMITWATANAPSALPLLRFLTVAIWTWLPIYLFLMAKRVYRQGWFMTTFKFALVGFCYTIMLAFGLAGAVIVSLAIA